MDRLICIIGQHRGGTSVACDLVAACGYSFGVQSPNDLRFSRHEHPIRKGHPQMTEEDAQVALVTLEESGANAVKLTTNIAPWLRNLNGIVKDLKIVAMLRSPLAISNSRSSGDSYAYAEDESSIEAVSYEQGGILTLLNRIAVPTLIIDFEQLLNDPVNHLRHLPLFLNSQVDASDLSSLIHPEIVIHG
jgi:hypothetical protein